MANGEKMKIPWILVVAIVSIAGGFEITKLLDGAGLFPEQKAFAHITSSVIRQVSTPTISSQIASTRKPTETATSVVPKATQVESADAPTAEASATTTDNVSPTVTATSTAVVQQNTEYIVKSGDTLLDIASAYNTTVAAIVTLNALPNEHALALGQKLLIPNASNKTSTPTPLPIPSQQLQQSYTVKPGDTLLDIAGRYNSSVDAIVSANNLTSPNAMIKDGQKLVIPVGR